MGILHFSIIGVTACAAAVAGAFVQTSLSHSGQGAADAPPEMSQYGVKFPPIPIPLYSQNGRIGYCVMRVEFQGERGDADGWRLAIPRVTNDLYIEFSAVLENNADGPAACATRVGMRTDTFVIYKAEFYEQIDPNKLRQDP